MNPAPKLVLKQSTGWFAAGWAFGDAMIILADSAFKLFAWLCLNAERHTGRMRITTAEIAQALGKSEADIQVAREELLVRGVCHGGMDVEIEIADRYWPYEKQRCESGSREYVAQVRKLLSAPACVQCRFSAADEQLARSLHQRAVSLAQVERAIWLGCARKYATLVANDAGPAPISSLSYFRAVIDEVVHEANTSDTYWAHVRRKAATLEREWLSRVRGRTGSIAG
jgi:hypothetical protein